MKMTKKAEHTLLSELHTIKRHKVNASKALDFDMELEKERYTTRVKSRQIREGEISPPGIEWSLLMHLEHFIG